jgi:hypothetical protein
MAEACKIFAYCERGGNPAFWAEPVNALSNLAFLIAACVGLFMLVRRGEGFTQRPAAWFLTCLVAIIGVGSFLFHTFATRWSAVADVVPIGLFMVAYLAYALRRFAGAGVVVTAILTALFVGVLRAAESLPCAPGLLPVTAAAGRPCLNGSLGYLPALGALLLTGVYLMVRQHRAGPHLVAAACLFAVSLTFRTLDTELCGLTGFLGQPRGTHAVWHLLNGALLGLLLTAAIRHGGPGGRSPAQSPLP